MSYTAFAPFHKEKFQGNNVAWDDDQGSSGTCSVVQLDLSDEDNLPSASITPKGVTANDLVGLRIEGAFWFETDDEGLTMWINTQDFSVIFPDQEMAPSFSYPGVGDVGMAEDCEAEIDTLRNELTFYYVPTFGGGYWWSIGITVTLHF